MKICNLCGKEIHTKTEKYVHLEDWFDEKMLREIWVHLVCFNKGMNRELTQMEKDAQNLLKRAGNIFQKIAPQEETYVI
jgi:hypothetical protein